MALAEHEKVAAFEALGIERGLLPVRVYRGAAGSTRRYFPVKLPVVLDDARAVFVYAEPGHETSTALRSWGGAHRGLWHALQRQGRSVEIVAVDPARREIARIEQAIRGMDDAVIEKHGGLQGCLERIVELKDQLRSARPGTAIDGFAAWRSSRLPGGGT